MYFINSTFDSAYLSHSFISSFLLAVQQAHASFMGLIQFYCSISVHFTGNKTNMIEKRKREEKEKEKNNHWKYVVQN